MDTKNIIQIHEYQSRCNLYKLDNVFYDYVKNLIFQKTRKGIKTIKPRLNHFIIWQKKAIFLSVQKLDEIVLKQFHREHLQELHEANPTAIIALDRL